MAACLYGCASGDDTTDDTDTDTETDASDTDTDTGEPGLPAISVFTWKVAFGWDEDPGQTRSFTVDGTETPSTVSLELKTSNWRPDSGPETFCTLTYEANGLSSEDLGDGGDWWVGLKFPTPVDKLVSDDCTDRVGTVFSEDSFVDSPTADVATWVGELGLGGAIDDSLTMDPTDDRDYTHGVGGEVHFPHEQEPDEDRTVALVGGFGYAVDASFVVIEDTDGARTELTVAGIPSGDSMVDGVYEAEGAPLFRFDPGGE